jgi:hypothetical protein
MVNTGQDNPLPRALWEAFCRRYRIAEESVPLFATDNAGHVQTKSWGKASRPILCRSEEMEALVRRETAKLVADHIHAPR